MVLEVIRADAHEDGSNTLLASVRAADTLRARILAGELPAGTALLESALAASLDISRNTLREALRQLLHEGLIEQALYRGAAVRRKPSWRN
ncbi:MAG: winged helix-turn-helix transcriptional regulator [Rhizobiaceae bacterium]|nr:winged helix-turn-helix transcriptional regulator [Rhizobiaceae bacterium]